MSIHTEIMLLEQKEIKKLLGAKAADLVEEGMLVGLGSGSTATCFIESLIERCKKGLKITAVSSSNHSLEIAQKGHIPIISMDDVTHIDLTVDGADEIDPFDHMIKGGGGAHVREKILAKASSRLVIIVDESKLVDKLGQCGLPVEILPFGYKATIQAIEKLRYKGKLRRKEDGSLYITDNGNYLFDLYFPKYFENPKEDHFKLINVAGVVDTGFFFDLPSKVLIGYKNGEVAFRN